ncbi:MAG: hypothetical protein V7K40_33155 [Nostoc sp.]|uniref:hypothetical protein n=1 Tax=Nostoc sp. TaxID=1180 RepID=UPI002FF9B489
MLTDTIKSTFKDAAQKLTGNRKRDFMAKVTEDYFDSSARKAETVLGWNRQSVQLGLHERRTGIVCIDNYQEPIPLIIFLLKSLSFLRTEDEKLRFSSTF